jgi:hypothetical protein
VPGVHRHGDSRYCGASTIVEGQDSVYVNGKLWAVDGDPCSHGNGDARAIYGACNVYINNKKVICAVGDTAYGADNKTHDPGPVDPKGHSDDVIVYGGAAGGR